MNNPHTQIDWSRWTDRMIANHFGQKWSKQEIEKIVGRPIDWKAIEPQA